MTADVGVGAGVSVGTGVGVSVGTGVKVGVNDGTSVGTGAKVGVGVMLFVISGADVYVGTEVGVNGFSETEGTTCSAVGQGVAVLENSLSGVGVFRALPGSTLHADINPHNIVIHSIVFFMLFRILILLILHKNLILSRRIFDIGNLWVYTLSIRFSWRSYMARNTEHDIVRTFEDMLEEMPFDKITVQGLTKRCDISPNTFYYHYEDIYELLRQWFALRAQRFLETRSEGEEWDVTFKKILKELKEHPNIVYHVADSLSRENLENYAYTSLHEAISNLGRKKVEGLGLDEKTLESIVNICSYALLGFFLRFVSSRMTIDENAVIDGISRAFNGIIEIYVLKKIMDAGTERT